ncbi:MAG TPA: DUF1499 domain-containing protein [Methylomirabilota bacterium]|nr:DUF1499 domain-containing protein [Methylomirabilota bacterium]
MADAVRSSDRHLSPLKFLAMIFVVIAVALGATAAGVAAYGREALWADIFGPPDMGAYDFDIPTRTGKLNDALACPVSAEPCFAASVDRTIPLFAVDGPTLYAAVVKRIQVLPGATAVESDPDRLSLRAVVRTPFLRFPDTLSMRVREEAPGRSGLWLYSRSQIGHADLGVNERRLRHLIRDLRRSLPVAPQDRG